MASPFTKQWPMSYIDRHGQRWVLGSLNMDRANNMVTESWITEAAYEAAQREMTHRRMALAIKRLDKIDNVEHGVQDDDMEGESDAAGSQPPAAKRTPPPPR